jgi:hypothetical protein
MNLGNLRGIPPHYIKGQIERESNFNPDTYRYEPLTTDRLAIGPKGQNLRTQDPYAKYRLATNDAVPDLNSQPWPTPTPIPTPTPQPTPTPPPGSKPRPTPKPKPTPTMVLPQGAELIPEDVAPRSNTNPPYLMCTQGMIVQGPNVDTCVGNTTMTLPASDSPPQLVSVRELVDLNDCYPEENCRSKQNWLKSSPGIANMLRNNWDLLDFTGETDLAASYGLVHVLYPTAIAPMHWNGQDGDLNPSYLFDDPDSRIDAGTSSLPLGTGYLAGHLFPENLAANPIFHGPDANGKNNDFVQTFTKAFQSYDPGEAGYGADVVQNRAAAYPPIPTGKIFSDQ